MADAQLSFPQTDPAKPPRTLFKEIRAKPQDSARLDALRDVELDVRIELGRSRMRVADVLKLAQGSVIALNRPAGEPVDVYVNDRLVARGQVMVLNDNFCVRVCEIVGGEEQPR